ncbi:YbaN family protein [Acinetobacter rathckeae]|uniref:YbaN family protein n=1 Tax=Acinetobacter rathckeae TaxID=2605272 RepID=UPI0018A2AE31|nr:YbaN family protein [Acinetobacter rathckeae]MBF7689022.1 YbaN family protein [Acinetobacter rathckeae]MBF7696542.1 YbaN family protein [Acinetobacter rathckeae]
MTIFVDQENPKSFWLRWVYFTLACVCIVLGFIGMFLPGLPTVDFFVLASFFAAKGSRRMHQWFVNHWWFGPILKQWHEHKTLPRSAKILSAVSMTVSALLMLYYIPHLEWVLVVIFCMLSFQVWLWAKK